MQSVVLQHASASTCYLSACVISPPPTFDLFILFPDCTVKEGEMTLSNMEQSWESNVKLLKQIQMNLTKTLAAN